MKQTLGYVEYWRFRLASGACLCLKKRSINYYGTITVEWDATLFQKDDIFSGSGRTRAEAIRDLRADIATVFAIPDTGLKGQ
jgi:hypothetical protein